MVRLALGSFSGVCWTRICGGGEWEEDYQGNGGAEAGSRPENGHWTRTGWDQGRLRQGLRSRARAGHHPGAERLWAHLRVWGYCVLRSLLRCGEEAGLLFALTLLRSIYFTLPSLPPPPQHLGLCNLLRE